MTVIPIAMTVKGRPQYLRQTLETLRTSVKYALQMDTSLKFVLVPLIEPSCDETKHVIESCTEFFDRCIPTFNQTRLGINENAKVAFDTAFQYGDVVIQSDEDADHSKDFLWYAVSMLRKYKDDDEVLYVTCHHNNQQDDRIDKVFRYFGSYVSSMSIWEHKYNWFRNHWIPSTCLHMTYDAHFNNQFPKDKACIIPIVARGKQNGFYGGTCMTPDMIWAQRRDNLWAGDFDPVKSWEEVSTVGLNT